MEERIQRMQSLLELDEGSGDYTWQMKRCQRDTGV